MTLNRRALLAGLTAGSTLAVPMIARAAPEPFELADHLMPQYVRVKPEFAASHLYVSPQTRYLYYVTEPERAIRYGVGVGPAGDSFRGNAVIQVKKEWPTWRPTDSMIERSPQTYARFVDNDYVQPGGPSNPLGARALYLFEDGYDTFYRIHGTTEPSSIGRAVSAGCIRMLNAHVIDLYERVPEGTPVTVY